jgi:hypothetical protein
MSTNYSHDPSEARKDFESYFYVFMLAFWPVALLFGIVDHWFITGYDFRVLDVLLGMIAGWIAIKFYDTRERTQNQAS